MSESDTIPARSTTGRTAMEKLFGAMSDSTCSQNNNSNSLVDTFELVKDELARFKRLNFDINNDPLAWWKDNSHMFPKLSAFAKQRLTVSGTSVPAERIFSKTGQLINAKRACLSSTNVDKLIFLNKNMPLV